MSSAEEWKKYVKINWNAKEFGWGTESGENWEQSNAPGLIKEPGRRKINSFEISFVGKKRYIQNSKKRGKIGVVISKLRPIQSSQRPRGKIIFFNLKNRHNKRKKL